MVLNLMTKLAVTTVGVSLSIAVMEANPAQAATFSDSYNSDAWTLTNTNSDGAVNTSNVPGSFLLTGGNKGGGYGAGSTTYTTTIFNPGTVSFNWDYSTLDVKGYYDPAGWSLNGVVTQLSDNNTKSSSGNVTTFVKAGDVFGFFVNTVDNIVGAASLKISSLFTTKSSSCSATYN